MSIVRFYITVFLLMVFNYAFTRNPKKVLESCNVIILFLQFLENPKGTTNNE